MMIILLSERNSKQTHYEINRIRPPVMHINPLPVQSVL